MLEEGRVEFVSRARGVWGAEEVRVFWTEWIVWWEVWSWLEYDLRHWKQFSADEAQSVRERSRRGEFLLVRNLPFRQEAMGHRTVAWRRLAFTTA